MCGSFISVPRKPDFAVEGGGGTQTMERRAMEGQSEDNNNSVLTPNMGKGWRSGEEFFRGKNRRSLLSPDTSSPVVKFSDSSRNGIKVFPSPDQIRKELMEAKEGLPLEVADEEFDGVNGEGVLVWDEEKNNYLFSPGVLNSVDFSRALNKFPEGISHLHPGEDLILRPLEVNDFCKKYMELMGQLTTAGQVTKPQFERQFHRMKTAGLYYILVLEDVFSKHVIGSASLILEPKFIHSTGFRGRIEDVVVNSEYRGRQLGKLLVETLTLLGEKLGVYKMSLECKDKLIPFYESFGYKKDEGNNFMVLRFKD